MKSIEGKTIIVVGASGGIGSVCVREFSKEGASVVLASRTKEKLEAIAADLPLERTLVVASDATSVPDVERLFATAKERFGSVDAVVISTGTWKQVGIEMPMAEAVTFAQKHFDAFFLPSFVVSGVAQQFFRRQGYGLIVNISSHAATKPELPDNLTYGPMKAASFHLMKCLHAALPPEIRVTDLQPAVVDTAVHAGTASTGKLSPAAIATWIMEHLDDATIPIQQKFEND